MTTPPKRTGEPLRIELLRARSFRNLAPLALCPGPHFNVLHGDKGAGKSNILEAIHYLGALRSFRNARAQELLAVGSETATLDARISDRAASRTATVELNRRGPRRLTLDGKRPRLTAAWYTAVPVVLFHPGDVTLPSGSKEGRRALLDRVLEQMDPTYGAALKDYDRALRSRNRLLRDGVADHRAISAYDEMLASAGAVVGRARAELVRELGPLAEASFGQMVGEDLPLRIRYLPRVEPEIESLRAALRRSLDRDRLRGFTAEGPHADDVTFEVKAGLSARHHASQGQHRALVLALKVAELSALSRRTGRIPILLLDDVSSELDDARNRRFFELLGSLGGQVFLTTTRPGYILLESDRCDFQVSAGRVTGPGAAPLA